MPLTPPQLAELTAITQAINDKLQLMQLPRTDLDALRRIGPEIEHGPSLQAVIDSRKANARAAAAELIVLLDAV